MKSNYKFLRSILVVLGVFSMNIVSAQCPAVTCPGSITLSNIPGTCGAVATWTPPVGTNVCGPPATQTFNYTGAVQTFTVPAGITAISIQALGGRGGNAGAGYNFTGGFGAKMQGDFTVTPGQVLNIVVGNTGSLTYNSGGGGGGSGVLSGLSPLIIAGGGGGASITENGQQGLITTTGGSSSGAGGTGGNGGEKAYRSGDCGWSGGGGGLLSDGRGGDGSWDGGPLPGVLGVSGGAKSWTNGGAGGSNGGCSFGLPNTGVFGCGGGGSGTYGGGGGGGYSGGGGGQYVDVAGKRGGGGGGSINNGTNQVNAAGFQNGNGQVTISYSLPISTALIAGLAPGSTFPVGTTVETYQVTDYLGNTAQCSFNIVVVDNEFPTISPQNNITVNNDPGVCGAVVTFNAPSATDNCSVIVTQTAGLASGATFPIGITTETFVATDPAGHTVTTSFTVTVTDSELPVITAPANVASCLPVINNIAPIGFSDNCSAFVTYTITGSTTGFGNNDASGTTFNLGVSTVTYKATDPAGNFSTASFNVTINPSYNIPKSVAICQGNSYFVGGAFQNTPGTYIDMLQTTKGCDSIITTQLVIDPAPAVTLSPFHVNSVCVDAGLISVPAGSPLGGTYSGNGVVILYSFDPGQAGVGTHWIYYTVANASGCTGKDSTQITVTPCTGIAESNEIPNIDVYPNPTNGQVTITLGNNQKSIEVTVMELNGSIVRTESYRNTNLVKTDISGLSSGMYFMRVKADDKISTVKIMKN